MSAVMLQVTLPYPMSGNHAKRQGANFYSVAKVRQYDSLVQEACVLAGCVGLVGPLDVTYEFMAPDNRTRDSDNVLKVLKDSLTEAGVWEDDCWRIVRRECVEWLGVESPGFVRITFRPFVANRASR